MSLFPYINLLAPVTSLALLIVLASAGDFGRIQLGVLIVWFVAAGFLQFHAATLGAAAAGLALQTALAIYLLIRWKIN
jgi:hypothetical protein